MRDRAFLMWLHERLEEVYKESPTVDYMHKLRGIIRATPAERESSNANTLNSLKELEIELLEEEILQEEHSLYILRQRLAEKKTIA